MGEIETKTPLNTHVFVSVAHAQQVLNAWRGDYNNVRPHSALQDRTPTMARTMWSTRVSHVSRLRARTPGMNVGPQVDS